MILKSIGKKLGFGIAEQPPKKVIFRMCPNVRIADITRIFPKKFDS
jgi:hypothetical protein